MLGTIVGAMIGVVLASEGITVKTVKINTYEKAQIDKVMEIANTIF